MEAATRDAKGLKGAGGSPHPVLTVSTPCGRCGRTNHEGKNCKFKDAKCHKCGKIGHIAPVCRSSNYNFKRTGQGPPGGQAKWLDTTNESDHPADHQEEPLFVINNLSSHPYQVTLQVNGQPLTMEVDTGAAVSLAPEAVLGSLFPAAQLNQTDTVLKTYTGERIPVKGTLSVDVRYGQQQVQNLQLLVVSGSGPSLMGRDWLKAVRLDWTTIGKVSSQDIESRVKDLQDKYHEVFAKGLGTITPFKAKLSVAQEATPKFFRPRPVPYALKERVESELDRLEMEGVLVKTHFSEWAAPIVAVPKRDGRIRLCGDYKVTINPILDIDQHPLPRPDDIFATLSGGQNFTTLDLTHAYNQLLLDVDSRKYVTVNTHKGLYQYTRLPFGVASAPAIFQRTMDAILQGIEGVAWYLDDVIITGKSADEHLHNLNKVLSRFKQHGVRLKVEKCRFMSPSVKFLGHVIDAEGLHTSEDKLKAIVQAPAPKNLQELRSFLGLLNYYSKFIPNLSTLLHPLNELLRKDAKWNWTKKCGDSFKLAKEKLVASKALVHYNPSLPMKMAGDASAYGIGAVISHVLPDGTERPVAFASRTLSNSEKNYAQVEKEALSLIFGIKRFHTYLYGRTFTIVTDHKPLTTILHPKKGIPPLAAARLQRWAWLLSAYHYHIEFRPTGDHANADGLSRLPLTEPTPEDTSPDPKIFNMSQMEALPVTARQLRVATSTDSVLSKVFRYTRDKWPRTVSEVLQPFLNRRHELTVEEGCLMWGIRVIIPKRLRSKLLEELHRDHPGVTKMKSVARSYMWWPGLDKELEQLAKACKECQAVKKAPPSAPLHPWTWPSKPWQRVHLDFAGPFQGTMFLVAVDAYSKWPEIRMMSQTTVSKTLDVLREWFAAHGIPEHLVTDNGPQFIADDFTTFTKRNGIRHVKSAPYHPASNGQAERFVQSFKQSLKASVSDGRSLNQRVSTYLMSYRSTPHSTTGVPPCQLFLQRNIRTRFDLLQPDCGRTVLDKQSSQKSNHDRRSRSREWVTGQRVLVRNLRPGPDWIPGTVAEVLGPVTYLIQTDSGQRWKRHCDQIKDWVHLPGNQNTQEESENLADTDSSTVSVEDVAPGNAAEATSLAGSDTGTTVQSGGLSGNPNTNVPATTPARRYPTRERHPPDRLS